MSSGGMTDDLNKERMHLLTRHLMRVCDGVEPSEDMWDHHLWYDDLGLTVVSYLFDPDRYGLADIDIRREWKVLAMMTVDTTFKVVKLSKFDFSEDDEMLLRLSL